MIIFGMKIITIPLADATHRALTEAALRDLRLPRMQARLILEQALTPELPRHITTATRVPPGPVERSSVGGSGSDGVGSDVMAGADPVVAETES